MFCKKNISYRVIFGKEDQTIKILWLSTYLICILFPADWDFIFVLKTLQWIVNVIYQTKWKTEYGRETHWRMTQSSSYLDQQITAATTYGRSCTPTAENQTSWTIGHILPQWNIYQMDSGYSQWFQDELHEATDGKQITVALLKEDCWNGMTAAWAQSAHKNPDSDLYNNREKSRNYKEYKSNNAETA